ncbi:hypothetical protein DFA_00683 [Cavenderia fasciculata]|uniref:RWP-RK domain-containing protein n=1 Tax=Cavenderia fasciculata TaxID=261658 RepID=F4PT82_CACFS|nr:uncharacterized protein DFA_00683 [Cavenderia fasciculata]EGG20818.1 hypothetical protein DFA_00683 [Cavenderia fasciculata]|eukprot:XP_004358668.1 hypothetical protein DFA_00683 [Cavenderia fasciculata]
MILSVCLYILDSFGSGIKNDIILMDNGFDNEKQRYLENNNNTHQLISHYYYYQILFVQTPFFTSTTAAHSIIFFFCYLPVYTLFSLSNHNTFIIPFRLYNNNNNNNNNKHYPRVIVVVEYSSKIVVVVTSNNNKDREQQHVLIRDNIITRYQSTSPSSSPVPINNNNNNNNNNASTTNHIIKKQRIELSSSSSSPSSSSLLLNNPYQSYLPIIANINKDQLQQQQQDGYNGQLLNILNPVQSECLIDDDSDSDNDHSLPTFKQFESRLSTTTSTGTKPSPLSSSASPSFIFKSHDSSPCSSPSLPVVVDNSQQQHQSLSPSPNNKQQIYQWMQELVDLKRRESILLDNIKNFTQHSTSSPSSSSSSPSSSTASVAASPTVTTATNMIIEDHSSDDHQVEYHNHRLLTPRDKLTIQHQPSDSVVCHRYIHPSPTLMVDQELINNRTVGSALVVQVSLVYNSTYKQVSAKQSDGKQEVLQGIKSLMVDRTGLVVFNKLKVSEVSSKHLHQSFCLVFALCEVFNDGRANQEVSSVTSSSFHVLSRNNTNNKRKKDDQDNSSDLSDGGNDHTSSPSSPSQPIHLASLSPMSSSGASQSTSSFSLMASNDEMNSSSSSSPSPQQPSVSLQHSLSETTTPSQQQQQQPSNNDPNYIDITELLVLPQKEAASRLGISESMLCKRFKECTRRKWPYRYLRKIDKVIKIITYQHGTDIPKEEKDKFDKLMAEREECLRPVKIRITGCLEKEDETGSPIYVKALSSSAFSHIHPNLVVSSGGLSTATATVATTTTNVKSQIHSIINSDDDDDQDMSDDNTPIKNQQPFKNSVFASAAGGDGNHGLENILETLEMLKHHARQ